MITYYIGIPSEQIAVKFALITDYVINIDRCYAIFTLRYVAVFVPLHHFLFLAFLFLTFSCLVLLKCIFEVIIILDFECRVLLGKRGGMGYCPHVMADVSLLWH